MRKTCLVQKSESKKNPKKRAHKKPTAKIKYCVNAQQKASFEATKMDFVAAKSKLDICFFLILGQWQAQEEARLWSQNKFANNLFLKCQWSWEKSAKIHHQPIVVDILWLVQDLFGNFPLSAFCFYLNCCLLRFASSRNLTHLQRTSFLLLLANDRIIGKFWIYWTKPFMIVKVEKKRLFENSGRWS